MRLNGKAGDDSGTKPPSAEIKRRHRQLPPMDTPAASGRQSHPTVLVATANHELRQRLACRLRAANCLVLDVDSLNRMLDVVIAHSRPIHVLLLDVGLSGWSVISHVKRYRPGMQLVTMVDHHLAGMEDALSPEDALREAQVLLGIAERSAHA